MCSDCPIPICISVGCPVKVSTNTGAQGRGRQCPKCHNVCVFEANRRRWIEICFVPLFPCSSKKIWHCDICNWQGDLDDPFQPGFPTAGPPPNGPGNGPMMMNIPPMQMVPPTGFAAPLGPHHLKALNTLAATVDSQQKTEKYL
ncbi:hypothetical protein H4Q26_012380 [Puccinia striiformis f. sp. tritici PST-130]|nr:hypothetical protein H4Q26_012380 [Puccinia striiformis f. sp. tritici PST-130]